MSLFRLVSFLRACAWSSISVRNLLADRMVPGVVQGYLLISERNKLKEEYFGLPGPEIAAAKNRGEVS